MMALAERLIVVVMVLVIGHLELLGLAGTARHLG